MTLAAEYLQEQRRKILIISREYFHHELDSSRSSLASERLGIQMPQALIMKDQEKRAFLKEHSQCILLL